MEDGRWETGSLSRRLPSPSFHLLFPLSDLLRPWPNEQTNAGHAPIHSAVARLLAPRQSSRTHPPAQPPRRKGPLLRPRYRFLRRHCLGPARWSCDGFTGEHPFGDAVGQCPQCLPGLPAKDLVACTPRGFLSTSGDARGGGTFFGDRSAGRSFSAGGLATDGAPRSGGRLVVVSRDAGAGARPGAGRPSGLCRSLHLYSFDRAVSIFVLGRGEP